MKPITVTVDYMRGEADAQMPRRATVERLGARSPRRAFAWQQDRATPIASGRLNFLLERPKR